MTPSTALRTDSALRCIVMSMSRFHPEAERKQTPGALKHASTLGQAMGLVYLVGLGMVLCGAAVDLTARGAIELLSWIAGLMR
jgi:hypothetical protein